MALDQQKAQATRAQRNQLAKSQRMIQEDARKQALARQARARTRQAHVDRAQALRRRIIKRPRGFIGPLAAEIRRPAPVAPTTFEEWSTSAREISLNGHSAAKKKRGLPGWLTPWKMREGMQPTEDMVLDDLVAEAQMHRPLLREFGLRDSALRHPADVNHRYLRTAGYLGKIPMKPYIWQLICTLVPPILFAIGFMAFAPATDHTTTTTVELPSWFYAIIGAFSGAFFGIPMGYGIRVASQFWTAHGFARIAQKVVEHGKRRTVAVLELPLPRLAFADRHDERIFSGTEDRSGFANGQMNLETEMNLQALTDVRELFLPGVLRASNSSYTGVNTTRRHSLNSQAKQAGQINAEKQALRRKGDIGGWMSEHKGLTFFIVAAIVSVIAMALGFQLDVSDAGSILG